MSKVTAENLSDVMDFGHVIRVTESGEVEDADGEYAPELSMEVDSDGQHLHADDSDLYGQAASKGWELMSGYTGQSGYRGPVMHSSEYIGGRMAGDILKGPGLYVAVVVETDDPDDDEPAGWAVAYKPTE